MRGISTAKENKAVKNREDEEKLCNTFQLFTICYVPGLI